MILTLSPYDFVTVVVILTVTIVLGLKGASHATSRLSSAREYILAGRALTLPLFVVSLVATWYGAVLGSGEFIVRHGIAMIFCFGLPYYLAAIVYAIWFIPRYHRLRAVSIPDMLGSMYGPIARRAASIVMLAMTIPAAYVLMLGTFVDGMTGWGTVPSMVIGTVVAGSIVIRGGLRSHAVSNGVQFLSMFVGFGVLLAACWFTLGGPRILIDELAPSAFDVPGTLGWPMIIAWWFIALQTFVDPNVHQRISAVGSPRTAQRGVIISVAFWILFDILQLSTGLYAMAFLSIDRPIDTYLVLAQAVLPPIYKGLFVAGVVSAIVSTLDGYALAAGATLSHDLLPSWFGGRWRYALGLILVFMAAIALASAVPSVVDLLFYAASVGVPAFLPTTLIGFSRWRNRVRRLGGWLIIAPAAMSILAIVAQRIADAPYLAGAEGMVAGLLTSCSMIGVIAIRSRLST